MISVNALQHLRQLIPDPKTEGFSLLYEDSFYEEIFARNKLNPNVPFAYITDEQYMKLRLDVWYALSGDLQKIRKLEEIGIVNGEFKAEEHIRMLEFRLSRFKKEVYGELAIP